MNGFYTYKSGLPEDKKGGQLGVGHPIVQPSKQTGIVINKVIKSLALVDRPIV